MCVRLKNIKLKGYVIADNFTYSCCQDIVGLRSEYYFIIDFYFVFESKNTEIDMQMVLNILIQCIDCVPIRIHIY